MKYDFLKKFLVFLLIVIIAEAAYFYFVSQREMTPKSENEKVSVEVPEKVEPIKLSDEEVARGLSENILVALVNGDLNYLKSFIHPKKGLRISIDGYVSDGDVILQADQLDYLINNKIKILWGYSDGMGAPITETVEDFLNKYVKFEYYKDSKTKVAYNNVLRGGSAGGNNLRDVYKTQNFMSYYIPYTGTYTDNGVEVPQTMGWRAINFIFEEYNGKTFLIGIVKDNWTI